MTRHPRGHILVATVAALLVVSAFGFAGWSFERARVEQCNTRDVWADILTDLLAEGRTRTEARSNMDPAERRFVLAFYDRYLTRIQEARCM